MKFYIGVTGHRWTKIQTSSRPEIALALREHMSQLDTGGMQPVLVSGMAEGADMIAADIRPQGWPLQPVLATSLRLWREHLARPPAQVPSDLELFDNLIRAAMPPIVAPNSKVLDFDFVAQYIVETCNHLIAIWDGRHGNRSGTSDVVKRARHNAIQVDVLWDPDWGLQKNT